jgi:hypothetical protein
MATKTPTQKVECLNPNSGRSFNMDKSIYDLFSKAIYHTLKTDKGLTFSEIVNGVHDCFKQKGQQFEGSVEWYTISVKKDMEAKGIIETYTEKGKTLNRIKK